MYPFGIDNEAFTPYAGAGLGVFIFSPDGVDGSTDIGINLKGGAEFAIESSIRPFAEANISFVFADDFLPDSLFGLTGGILFSL